MPDRLGAPPNAARTGFPGQEGALLPLSGGLGTPGRPERPGATGPAPRILLYCHDTYGLGHLRRVLRVAAQIATRWPEASQLVVTGSPVAHRFRFPPRTDYIKLPSVLKEDRDRYVSRSLAMDFAAIRRLRSDIVADAARLFRPDVLIADHAPTGLARELLPTLELLHRRVPRPTLVVGLRDVIDDPALVRHAWHRDGVYDLFDEVYDRILVYGDAEVYDVRHEYALSPRSAAKVRFVGYLGEQATSEAVQAARRRLRLDGHRLVLSTVGGGGDGARVLRAVADAIGEARPELRLSALLVAGPLMTDRDAAAISASVKPPSVRLVDFVDDLPAAIGAADVVVAMGGYNTVAELLAAGRPTLLVPRTSPRREQLIRAELLRRRGLVRVLTPEQLGPRRLLREVLELLDTSPPAQARPLFVQDGVAAALDDVLMTRPSAVGVAR